jgi:hypothetical protein
VLDFGVEMALSLSESSLVVSIWVGTSFGSTLVLTLGRLYSLSSFLSTICSRSSSSVFFLINITVPCFFIVGLFIVLLVWRALLGVIMFLEL